MDQGGRYLMISILMSRRGAYGFAAMLAATALWGISLAAPALLPTVSPPDLVCGRYLVYGLVSACLVLGHGRAALAVLGSHWIRALAYALLANCGFYLLVALAVQRAGAELAIATVGLLPICVALAGNSAFKEAEWHRLLLPFLVFGSGLLTIGWSRLGGGFISGHAALVGTAAAGAAVAGWTWYAVSNARFLRGESGVGPDAWSSAVGIATLLVSLAWLVIRHWVHMAGPEGGGQQGLPLSPAFVAMSVVLGLLSSWCATALFNRASKSLPMALVGQLIVCEVVFGVGYVHAFSRSPVSMFTLAGFALAIIGISWSVRSLNEPAGPRGEQEAAA